MANDVEWVWRVLLLAIDVRLIFSWSTWRSLFLLVILVVVKSPSNLGYWTGRLWSISLMMRWLAVAWWFLGQAGLSVIGWHRCYISCTEFLTVRIIGWITSFLRGIIGVGGPQRGGIYLFDCLLIFNLSMENILKFLCMIVAIYILGRHWPGFDSRIRQSPLLVFRVSFTVGIFPLVR